MNFISISQRTLTLFLLLFPNLVLQAQQISCIAGTGFYGFADGQAQCSIAQYHYPTGIAIDGDGTMYISDNHSIRRIDVDGSVVTVAGIGGNSGSSDGTGIAASFNQPKGLVLDASHNLYVADFGNHKIRKITPEGIVTTFAGTGVAGHADGPALSATFFNPTDIKIDAFGNFFIADINNNEIRKISTDGTVSTFAGQISPGDVDATGTNAKFNAPSSIVFDTFGNLCITDSGNHKIKKIAPDAEVNTFVGSGAAGSANGTGTAATFNSPWGIAIDASQNLYVSDENNHYIRKITPSGVVSYFAGVGYAIYDEEGVFGFDHPTAMAVDIFNTIYITDSGNNKIKKITSAGILSIYSGSGIEGSRNGASTGAQFNFPGSVVLDASGNLYVADGNNNRIRKVTPAGMVSTIASSGFNTPSGIAIDQSGDLYVADTYNNTIKKISSNGTVSVLAGSGTAGDTDATGTAARFNQPYGITVDASGNVYVADMNNNKIRKITATGVVTTLAGSGAAGNVNATGASASFHSPYGVAVDPLGNCYVADFNNNKIRKITSAGVVSDFANASGVFSVSVGPDAYIYSANAGSHTIGKFNSSGNEVDGWGQPFSAGSTDGSADVASFKVPTGVVIDASGNIFVADRDNSKIRKIIQSPTTGIFEEQSNEAIDVLLYPNPANKMLHIKTDFIGSCDMLNHTGEMVNHYSMVENNTIDISALKPGIYLLKIKTDKGYAVQKFIKE